MRVPEIYRCQNREGAAEIEVMKDSIEGASLPRCCCGAGMKKPYAKPVLKIVSEQDSAAMTMAAGMNSK